MTVLTITVATKWCLILFIKGVTKIEKTTTGHNDGTDWFYPSIFRNDMPASIFNSKIVVFETKELFTNM